MGAFEQFLLSVVAFYQEIESTTDPLVMRAATTIVAISLYAIFAGSFYETFSRRMIFKLNLPKPTLFGKEGVHVRLWDIFVLIIQYTVAFPIITLIWTTALTLFLLALSSSPPWEVAILSLSIVAATRLCSYYNEKIAVDVAKLLPIALLAIVVSDPGSLSYTVMLERLNELVQIAHQFVPLFLFLVAMEWALRFAIEIKYALFGSPESEESELDKLLSHYSKPKKR
ncbi:MAG: hypothetical protein ABIH83_04970 [Candidatus Micrarchaeota archaeon]